MMIDWKRSAAVIATMAITTNPLLAATPAYPTPAKECKLAQLAMDEDSARAAAKLPFPPVQLDISVPFEPTLFPAGEFRYLVYELHLQNYADQPMTLRGVEVLAVSGAISKPVAAFTDANLYERLLPIGADKIDSDRPLEGGKRAVVFICLAFDNDIVPDQLGHRVLVDGFAAEGPVITTRSSTLKVLAPPVTGKDWVADNGPSIHSHHRTGIFIAGGRAQISRRYAIDWKQSKEGTTFSGDPRDVHSYFTYGESVFAVADATVISAVDGLPDNIPRTAAGFTTAVPITMENVAGNAIVLDLGDGQFAYYAHLKAGTVRVEAGDRVKRGDFLGQIGNSGDARWPHLHFQVATGPDILAAEGVPFLIDRYRAQGEGGDWQIRTGEYPLGDIAVEFVAAGAAMPDDDQRD